MNAALHLRQLGAAVSLISRIGSDKEGKDLLDFIHGFGLSTDYIQIDPELPTGRVLVDESDSENRVYQIVKPVAWDQIEWTESQKDLVDHSDAFIFGSLAARAESSRNTLFNLLETPSLKVMDLNLRAPFYTFEILEKLLKLTDILKINEEELNCLATFHQLPRGTETALQKLTELYDFQLVCVTLGKNGACIYHEEEIIEHPGYKVKVKDTIGSGDAFVSGLVHSYLMNKPLEQVLDDACALGAWVATHKGGTPAYDQSEIDNIKAE